VKFLDLSDLSDDFLYSVHIAKYFDRGGLMRVDLELRKLPPHAEDDPAR
jgi:hypothetical protein